MEKETASLAFDDLPLDPIGPRGNAWGRFGPDDQLGTLNLLTPEVVASAAKEICTGIRISLDWPLNMPSYPSFNRDPFEQRLVSRKPHRINDDVLTFNTQCSSQWDGFRHYGRLPFVNIQWRTYVHIYITNRCRPLRSESEV